MTFTGTRYITHTHPEVERPRLAPSLPLFILLFFLLLPPAVWRNICRWLLAYYCTKSASWCLFSKQAHTKTGFLQLLVGGKQQLAQRGEKKFKSQNFERGPAEPVNLTYKVSRQLPIQVMKSVMRETEMCPSTPMTLHDQLAHPVVWFCGKKKFKL